MRVGQSTSIINHPKAVEVDTDALALIVDLPGVYLLEVRKRTDDDPPFYQENHGQPMFDMVARCL